jgi:predicted patatin/cPLA2 family phospholipase
MRVLVLEGGGMRGVYTAGVLEALSEAESETEAESLDFDHVVACSAGACNAASYLADQPERNRRVYLDFLDGRKLVRFSRLLVGGSIMDIDYLTDEVTVRLCPLDLERLRRCPTRLHIGVTDCDTGEVRYLTNHDDELLTAFRATCALPFFYRGRVFYQGRRYVDGGVADPVPIQKALSLGAKELVVVLTSDIEARGQSSPGAVHVLVNRLLSPSAAVSEAMTERRYRYKEAAALLASPPEGVVVRVIRPSRPLPVKRTTTDRALLEAACDLGYADGRAFVRDLST